MDQSVLNYMDGILPAIRSMADNASLIITWALSVTGGSILAIISSSYTKPSALPGKLIYLFFVPGWVLFAISIYNGNSVARSYNGAQIALAQTKNDFICIKLDAALKTHEVFIKAWSGANEGYGQQMITFEWGLLCFAAWLIAFFAWWLFSKPASDSKTA